MVEGECELMNPEKIYDRVIDELDKLKRVSDLSVKSDDVRETQQKIATFIDAQEKEMRQQITELKRLSEWDEFTVAFYGETNAGKSTMIDTLRSIMNDPEKLQHHQLFDDAQMTYQRVDEKAQIVSDKLAQIEATQEIETKEFAHQIQALTNDITRLKDDNIDLAQLKAFDNWQVGLKSLLNLRYFMKAVFRKSDEKTELDQVDTLRDANVTQMQELSDDLSKAQTEQAAITEKYRPEITKASSELANLDEQRSQMVAEMTKYEDGQSIGDGRSDYTRIATDYHLSVNGTPFRMIDLPGIEGAESEVIAEINNALKSAHAVFYISRKATPPQNGEGENGGTIGKIKRQLADMSEVYFVYNKKTTNPRDMRGAMESTEERLALTSVDQVLADTLGTHYVGHRTVIGLAGHYAASRFAPDTRKNKKQTKYMSEFGTPEKLLTMSGVQDLATFISQDLVKDVNHKIRVANFSKVNASLENLQSSLNTYLQDTKTQKIRLDDLEKDTNQQISSLNDSLRRNIQKSIDDAVRKFNQDVRQAVYDKIETDISDQELKASYKTIASDHSKLTQETIRDVTQDAILKYQAGAQKAMKQYYEFADNILGSSGFTASFFETDDLNIKRHAVNGQDFAEVLVGVGSAIAAILLAPEITVAAIVAAVISALALGLNIGKKIWKALNPAYKMAEQRKYTDKQLDKATDKLRDQLTGTILPTVDQAITEATVGLQEQRNVGEQLGVIIKQLETATSRTTDIQRAVQMEMG